MSMCPVCGRAVNETAAKVQTGQTAHGAKEVDPKQGTRQFHDGTWYYFDSIGCRNRFTARPDEYLKKPAQ